MTGIKLTLGMLPIILRSYDPLVECSQLIYTVAGIQCYYAFGLARDLAAILAFYYFEDTKRVAKIFSCLTIGTEMAIMVPGVLALAYRV